MTEPSDLPPDQKTQIDNVVPYRAPATPKKPRRLLVTSLNVRKGEVRRGHPSIPAGGYAIRLMGEKSGAYEAVFDNDVKCFHPDRIKQFDAVCFNNTSGMITEDPELQWGLLNFVRGGGGFVGIHAATTTFCAYPVYDQFPEFGAMIGGYENGGHPWGPDETVVFQPEEPDHPVNKPFRGDSFALLEEVFQFKDHYSRDRLRVLLKIDTEQMDAGPERRMLPERREDMDFAVSWIRREAEGRVFYSALGHNAAVFWQANILAHLLAGIQYALGDLVCDDTPSNAR